MDKFIPLVRPYLSGKELTYIERLFASGSLSAGSVFSKQAEALLSDLTGCPNALLVSSCSAALEVAAVLLRLEPGDEVIVPSFTFVTTVSSFARFGARPIFADIRADTCNIDEAVVPALITPRTRAIVAVHYAGVPAEVDALREVARRHDLVVIEDAAQALCAKYRDRAVGSLGELAAFSFHETKNFVCGEGGALCVNDSSLVDRAHITRDKGTNRRKFMLGQVDKYTWVDMGASYVLSELGAAMLQAQLETVQEITRKRKLAYERYTRDFADLSASGFITLPAIPAGCESNYHLFHLLLAEPSHRPQMLAFLRDRGIGATFHYVPLHNSPQGQQLGGDGFDLPVTDRVSRTIVRLPLFPDLTSTEQDRVVDAVHEFFENH